MPVTALRRHGRSTHRSARRGLSIRQAQVSRVGWAVFNVCRRDLQGAATARPIKNELPQRPQREAFAPGAIACRPSRARPPGAAPPFGPREARRQATRYLGPAILARHRTATGAPGRGYWPWVLAVGTGRGYPGGCPRLMWPAALPLPPGFDDGFGWCLCPGVAGTAHRQSTLKQCLHVGAVERPGMGSIKIPGDRR